MYCESVLPARLSIFQSGIVDQMQLTQLVFMFEVPSKLRQLGLPMNDSVSLCIPDCVKVLTGRLRKCERHDRLLHFGRQPRLMKICLNCSNDLKPLTGRS
jgi:hypothetical protein